MPGFFSLLPGVFHADPGLDIPFYFSNRAEIAYSLWYPPDESAQEVRAQIEEHVLTASRLDPWLREHPPRFDVDQQLARRVSTPWEHPLVQTMVRVARDAPRARPSRHRARSIRSPSARLPTRRSTRLAGMPSVVFGPGDLRIAHCKDESVMLPEIVAAAKSLAVGGDGVVRCRCVGPGRRS